MDHRIKEQGKNKSMKILCLHGFRTSGKYLKKQLSIWDPSIFAHFHMDFPDGFFPAVGKSEIEGVFPPPYFEWFHYKKGFADTEYINLEECISHLCEYITNKGPFDGLLGFSQGAALCGLLAGYQSQGKVLKDHPPIKFVISISGAKYWPKEVCDVAYKNPIKAKSIHFIGDKDWMKPFSEDLATVFHDSLIIRHPQGHLVPKLDECATEQLLNWMKDVSEINDIQNRENEIKIKKVHGEIRISSRI